MSEWTHSTCDACWVERRGDEVAYRVLHAERETCCFCGLTHKSGIYVRHDGAMLPRCGGHEEDA